MQSLYNELAPYYDEIVKPGVNTDAEVEFLQSVFAKHGTASVLDIACGTGRHSIALAEKGFTVTGIDYSSELLKVAQSKVSSNNPVFEQQDVRSLSLGRQFDAAICMWSTFGELPYRELLAGLPQCLGEKALFIIDTHFFENYPAEPIQQSFTTSLSDGRVLKTEISDTYEGKRRMREVVNTVGDSVTNDHSEMDIMTEPDLVALITAAGFNHAASFYDYLQTEQPSTKRLQLVFTKAAR